MLARYQRGVVNFGNAEHLAADRLPRLLGDLEEDVGGQAVPTARGGLIVAVDPVMTRLDSSRSTRVYALAREMCSFSASARIESRPSARSAARIRKSMSSSAAICPSSAPSVPRFSVMWPTITGSHGHMS